MAVLKVNTVNEYTGPSVERALAPLIEHGALKVVYGGAAVRSGGRAGPVTSAASDAFLACS